MNPPMPTPAFELVTALRRFHRLLQARLDGALNGLGLSYAQYEVLRLLREEPNLHAGAIGRRLGITRQAAHSLLRQLQQADLVELLPRDGGIRGAYLTGRSDRRIRRCVDAVAHATAPLADLDRGTAQSLLDALDVCERALTRPPPPWWLE